MNGRLLGAALLAGGLSGLLPNPGLAQAPPIQDDPQARDHVLRLPPSYNPAVDAPSNDNRTPRSDGSQYGAPQYGPYAGQSQPPQTYQNNPYQSPTAPRYGGSLLGAPNVQTPSYGVPPTYGAPQPYGSGQAANPGYGGQQPSGGFQAGPSVPPVQSPRYAPGDPNAYGSVAQPNPYVRPNNGPQPNDSQNSSITQEPLAPLPGTAATQAQQPSQPSAPQSGTPGQLATPQAPGDAQGPNGSPAAPGTEAQQTPAPAPDLPNIWLPAGVAKLQALDKVDAQAKTLSVKVGQSTTFESLTITVKSCVVRPPDQPADAAAFVDVTDSHPGSEGFSGWLLENEPAVSIMQHPIYDLRVAGCA